MLGQIELLNGYEAEAFRRSGSRRYWHRQSTGHRREDPRASACSVSIPRGGTPLRVQSPAQVAGHP
jgi:hypothetical protein